MSASTGFPAFEEAITNTFPTAVVCREGVERQFCLRQRLFEYPAEIRKMIYTTNAIESFNSALRRVTDRKAAFPNETAVMKILYLRTLDVVKKWTVPYPNWSLIRGKLDILWGVGWDL